MVSCRYNNANVFSILLFLGMKKFFSFVFVLGCFPLFGQPGYWQQHVSYTIEAELNHQNHQIKGKEKLVLTNNSPDTLSKVYFHLYWNAFQPGSMMDVRSRNIEDPDPRVGARIAGLKPNEIGIQKVVNMSQDGKVLSLSERETILEVTLSKPLFPGKKTTLALDFEAQVPVQIRRSGRNNAEGVDYSMSQWYPKLCEYDKDGWNLSPYVGREFYGVWGDFDVSLTVDTSYTIGATGYLQQPETIGKGYAPLAKPYTSSKVTWRFVAPQVHDFVWAADPKFVHKKTKTADGIDLHFFHMDEAPLHKTWDTLMTVMVKSFAIANRKFGKYPYQQFSFIQGGDGGMEYPMATLMVGKTPINSLVGTAIHEKMHNWYYGILGTNEAKYPWMDEGFTSYAEDMILREILGGKGNPLNAAYQAYFRMALSGREEPLTTQADAYHWNTHFSNGSYNKGSIFLHQLSSIVGQPVLDQILLKYFDQWKFKHPTPQDLKKIAEKESGMDLEWYWEQWIGTVNTVDYALRQVSQNQKSGKTELVLERVGRLPMPVDVEVVLEDSSKMIFTIPLAAMQGSKSKDVYDGPLIGCTPWPWTHPFYTIEIPTADKKIRSIQIDPTERLADVNRKNQSWPWDKSSATKGQVLLQPISK